MKAKMPAAPKEQAKGKAKSSPKKAPSEANCEIIHIRRRLLPRSPVLRGRS
jgi:hypothetical protein